MKVLFMARPGFEKGLAGDSIQIIKTMEYLSKKGTDIRVTSSVHTDVKYYDLIHIFNVSRVQDVFTLYRLAAAHKKRIVVSPIFIDMRQYYGGRNEAYLASWRSANLMRREILAGASMLLPNSLQEARWIRELLLVDTPFRVVYNGVDPSMAEGDGDEFTRQYGIKDFILCVGRLSPIKNQLGLIRAIKVLKVPLVLIGPVNNHTYAKKCAEEAEGGIKYIPALPHQRLSNAYCASAIHVQPSFFETAGLASLEAGAAGTPVVVTQRGAAREYLGEHAVYVDPDNAHSIRTGIEKALMAERNKVLQTHVLEQFTWERAAADTYHAYLEVMDLPAVRSKASLPGYIQEYNISQQSCK